MSAVIIENHAGLKEINLFCWPIPRMGVSGLSNRILSPLRSVFAFKMFIVMEKSQFLAFRLSECKNKATIAIVYPSMIS